MNGWGICHTGWLVGLNTQARLAQSQAQAVSRWLSHWRTGNLPRPERLPHVWREGLERSLQQQLEWHQILAQGQHDWVRRALYQSGLAPARLMDDVVRSLTAPSTTVVRLLDTTARAWSLTQAAATASPAIEPESALVPA